MSWDGKAGNSILLLSTTNVILATTTLRENTNTRCQYMWFYLRKNNIHCEKGSNPRSRTTHKKTSCMLSHGAVVGVRSQSRDSSYVSHWGPGQSMSLAWPRRSVHITGLMMSRSGQFLVEPSTHLCQPLIGGSKFCPGWGRFSKSCRNTLRYDVPEEWYTASSILQEGGSSSTIGTPSYPSRARHSHLTRGTPILEAP